mmetsp:Transcript_54989/g.158194  ORF Transcript_54989/g.158194 Transcript_54989/m.158194 type:complete len:417 (-) Transcript_54989:74-1324(-)
MALAPAVMAVAAGGFGPTETPVRQAELQLSASPVMLEVAALEEVCRRSEAALNAEILKLCANEGAVPDAAASVDRGGAMKLTTESLSKALGANTLAANAAAAAAALEVPGDVESTSLAVSGDSASEAPAPTSEQETFGTGTSEPFAAVAEAAAPAPEKEASPPVEAFAPVTSGPEEESVLAPETSEAFAAVGEEALGPVPEKETTHAIEEASTGAGAAELLGAAPEEECGSTIERLAAVADRFGVEEASKESKAVEEPLGTFAVDAFSGMGIGAFAALKGAASPTGTTEMMLPEKLEALMGATSPTGTTEMMLPEKLEVTQCVIDDEKRTAVLEALVAAVAEKGAIPVSNGVYDVDVFPEAAVATPPSCEIVDNIKEHTSSLVLAVSPGRRPRRGRAPPGPRLLGVRLRLGCQQTL